MRRPPPWTEFPRCPATAGTILPAIGATGAYRAKMDVSPLFDGPGIRQWQLWRLFTSALVHQDAIHLIFNIYWVWVFGTLIEAVFGSVRTALLFLLLAAGSGAADYAFLHGGIGLSGVGYGLFALVWVLETRDARFKNAVDANTVGVFVIWFFICIFMTIQHIMAIANIAHGAGALLGALVGFAIVGRRLARRAAVAAIFAITVLFVGGATAWRPYINFSRDGDGEAQLGFLALEQNRDAEARQWCLDAIRIEPGNAGAWFNLGIANERLHDPKAAAEAFSRAHELEPANTRYRAAARF